jgi:hypothetical protein
MRTQIRKSASIRPGPRPVAIGVACVLLGVPSCGGLIAPSGDSPRSADSGPATPATSPADAATPNDATASSRDVASDDVTLDAAVDQGSSGGDAADAAIGCADGFALCGIACVDVATDGENCGRCGHGCQGGGCKAGQCQAVSLIDGGGVFSFTGGGVTLASDATSLYWSDGVHKIWALPKTGGTPRALASPGAEFFVADATNVYLPIAADPTSAAPNGGVLAVPTRGDAGAMLFTAPSPCCSGSIAVDDANVYFLYGSSLESVSKTGGLPVVVTTTIASPTSLIVSGANVYWVEYSGKVLTVPTTGGTPVTLATPPGVAPTVTTDPRLTTDSARIDWYAYSQGAVYSVAIDGGPVDVLVPAPSVLPQSWNSGAGSIATDSGRVYWLADDAVWSVPATGGTATVLASNQPVAFGGGLAVDETAVYWVTQKTVMKLAK